MSISPGLKTVIRLRAMAGSRRYYSAAGAVEQYYVEYCSMCHLVSIVSDAVGIGAEVELDV